MQIKESIALEEELFLKYLDKRVLLHLISESSSVDEIFFKVISYIYSNGQLSISSENKKPRRGQIKAIKFKKSDEGNIIEVEFDWLAETERYSVWNCTNPEDRWHVIKNQNYQIHLGLLKEMKISGGMFLELFMSDIEEDATFIPYYFPGLLPEHIKGLETEEISKD